MAIEVLIFAQGAKKGHIIYERQSPWKWGSKEGIPDFIRVTVTGAVTLEQARAYRDSWTCKYDWVVDNYSAVQDGYRVTISGEKVNLSGVGAITKAKLDTHLEKMGFVHHTTAQNAVTYDFSIYTVSTSGWFWGRDLTDVTFQENSYVQGTGVHTIQADYGAAGWPMDKVADMVSKKGATVVNNLASVITFTIDKTVVNGILKNYFRERVDATVEERQFYVTESYVDTVVAGTGLDTKTKAEFLALINNRLDE